MTATIDDVDDAFVENIKTARALPSPPAVAARLIELAEDPDASLNELVQILQSDPALTARVLRLANSPLYGRSQRAESLHHAVVMLGMDAVFTAALSLTVLSDRESIGGSSQVVQRQWTRSVRAAAAAQILARRTNGLAPTDAFLGALLQDIGVLVLLRLTPGIYRDLPTDFQHDDLIRCETERLGMDHAMVAGILLESWDLPARIVDAVARSHDGGTVDDRLANVVAVGGLIADWLDGAALLPSIVALAEELIGIDTEALAHALDELGTVLPDLSILFEATPPPADSIADMAADVLVARELRRRMATADRDVDELAGMSQIARELVAASRVDALTGLVNRGHLDVLLDRGFDRAKSTNTGLGILFVDLDDFKSVNERYGHHGGDVVLRVVADRIARSIRGRDVAARYGGDEFVVILTDATGDQVEGIADRLVEVFRSSPIEVVDGVTHHQTITVGAASLDDLPHASTSQELVRMADDALLAAKRAGKSRFQIANEL